jgi:hypothetical protein
MEKLDASHSGPCWQSLGGGVASNPTATADASGPYALVHASDNSLWVQHLNTGGTSPG